MTRGPRRISIRRGPLSFAGGPSLPAATTYNQQDEGRRGTSSRAATTDEDEVLLMTSKTTTRTLDPAMLDRPVSGFNLEPGNLRDQLGDPPRPTLLVFLRHFG
jgi:hypothetical protein